MHFISYAAMFAGQYKIALNATKDIQKTLPISLISDNILGKYFESFYSLDVHVYIRFGKWNELLSLEIPKDEKVYYFIYSFI